VSTAAATATNTRPRSTVAVGAALRAPSPVVASGRLTP
jgi:hypothetical protein